MIIIARGSKKQPLFALKPSTFCLFCKTSQQLSKMAAIAAPEQIEQAINKSQEAVTQQGDIVRSLKASLKDGKAQQVQCSCLRLQLLGAALISSAAAARVSLFLQTMYAGRGGCCYQEAAGAEAGAG